MSAIIDANYLFCSELLSGSDEVKKRWRVAVTFIYCSRAFLSLPSSTFHVIDVDEEQPPFADIDRSILTKLVEVKSMDALAKVGGVDVICASLKTDQQSGIDGDEEDMASRYAAFGGNTYPKAPTESFLHFVWDELKDLSLLIQLVCCVLLFVFGSYADGGSLLVAAFLVMFVCAISNFKQSRQFDKLSNVSDDIPVEVVRNGRRQQVSIFEIVVGDVVCLKIGDQVPANGLFIDGHFLQVDESSMTGEGDHVRVDRVEHPFLFSGTKVADGYAKMVVTSVGVNTFWGQMMSTRSCDSDDQQTPLQAHIKRLKLSLCKVGVVVALVVFVVLLVRYFTGKTEDEDGNTEFNGRETKAIDMIKALLDIITTCVAIVVVAMPEGLPLSVTLVQTYSMKRVKADKAVVRKLSACETMGFATTICTDKTGTLTLNQMKVTKAWVGKESMEGSSIGRNVVELFHQGVGLNTTGSVYKSGDSFEFSGSPTEKAILSWAVMEMKMDMEEVVKGCEILRVEVFNSEKKRSGVVMKKVEDGSFHVHWKGAAEMILAMCDYYYDSEGNMKGICGNERMEFDQIIQGMAASGLRCIAFAHKQVFSEANSIEENGLTLMGFVGLKDPCRPGVKKAVEDCQFAGVNVKMITGDNVFTAKAIATECGILHPNQDHKDELVVEGVVFRNYTEEERMEKIDKIRVMARSSPFDKLLMVQCLKKKGHVVAVTGDGANDAPALKEADIGLSMGIQGTEVAKESSDIVILDDNFASVVTILKWGRCVYSNIQKSIQFQLAVNVGALVINFVAAVSGVEQPLTIIQLLWVNLVMDTLGALALTMEKPGEEIMEQWPVGRSKPLISNVMWRDLLAQALYQIFVLLILQFKGGSILNISETVNATLIFNIFVLCQIFNMFNARKGEKKNVFEGIEKNWLFVGIIGITVVLQVVMVEFLNKFADTERLNLWEWGMCIGIAAASWPIALLVKFVPAPETPFFSCLPCEDSVELEIIDLN